MSENKIAQHKDDYYPRHGSWHSIVNGMRKSIKEIDRILIDDGGDIFIYMRHDDNRMWCHHCTIADDDLRKSIDEGIVGKGVEIQIRLEGKWPI